MELQLKLQLETALSRVQEGEKEAAELKVQIVKQTEQIIDLRKGPNRLERGAPDTGKALNTGSNGLVLELQSNPNFRPKILRTTLEAKSPSTLPPCPDQLTKRQAVSHRSNPTSPYREMHPSRTRLSPATDRRHIRVASDRIGRTNRLRTGLRH